MARLEELSAHYREASARLRLAAADRRERAAAGDRQAARELALLEGMLREMRDLRQLTAGYYTHPRSGAYTTATLLAPRRDMTKA